MGGVAWGPGVETRSVGGQAKRRISISTLQTVDMILDVIRLSRAMGLGHESICAWYYGLGYAGNCSDVEGGEKQWRCDSFYKSLC
jgi:hypothetical protein